MPKIQTNNINTYYEISGKGETLVFIHGLGSSAEDWHFQTNFFSKNFQAIAYDVRGHGQSEKAKPPYSVALFTKDLKALLDKLGIEKAHIIGLSMGGWIAFQFALDYPNAIVSLTIVNSWADMRLKTFQNKLNFFQRSVLFRLLSMRKIGEVIGARMFIKAEQKELLEGFVDKWAKNHKPSYMASFKAAKGWTVEKRLGEITCPVLVIAADEDYSPVSAKEAYVKKMPNARLAVIEDSRHATPVEKPDEFNEVLLDFLQVL
ncbi:MAG: alpha/beta hydrolase [Anaerolineae bacterium]|jgi:3-oxoadipate enol-lactonase|nr:alpha/beta hydrolase [Anaerolineae bacterium]MBT7075882.1 alpha/beta hydrolase [Anaerolineae bacterium]MBT7783882.1 alpha/beta hydrolase [Anaerolineae bacterium]